MTPQNNANRFPIYLAEIKTDSDGSRYFKKAETPYANKIWGSKYTSFFFKMRKTYFDKPNCNFNCPPGRKFFCCAQFDCRAHFGYFEWEEIAFFSEEEKNKILSYWNNGTGFLRKDGCALPRELRSYLCLAFVCRDGEIKG